MKNGEADETVEIMAMVSQLERERESIEEQAFGVNCKAETERECYEERERGK